MKSEIRIPETKQTYPCLMESSAACTKGLVVLFSSEREGTVIKLPDDPTVTLTA